MPGLLRETVRWRGDGARPLEEALDQTVDEGLFLYCAGYDNRMYDMY